MDFIRSFAIRFTEPSSWAGIGVALGYVGVSNSGIVKAVTLIGAGVACLLAVLIPEKAVAK